MTAPPGFPLPDLTTSLPSGPFSYGAEAVREVAALRTAPPAAVFHQLLGDQESETTLLVARHVLEAFLPSPTAGEEAAAAPDGAAETTVEALVDLVARTRAELAERIAPLREADAETRDLVLRQRAPLSLLSGCWLDTLSQPATQPSVIVNRLFGQHFRLLGEGQPQRGLLRLRRRALTELDVYLPEIEAVDFLAQADARPLTTLHASFFLALSRLPASHLPEIVAVHYAVHALGVDDLLLGAEPFLSATEVRETLTEYAELTAQSPTGAADWRRLCAALRLVLRLEREHVDLLTSLASWHAGLSLDAKVAAIVARHAPFSGSQHRNVKIGGRPLTEWFAEPELDPAAFVREFRASRQVQPSRGGCRFLRSIKFGGPMFGIFDEREAATFTAWTQSVQAGDPPDLDIEPCTAGDEAAATWSAALAHSQPTDVVVATTTPSDEREFFHRLVNIEWFPHMLRPARERAEAGLADAEILFTHGAGGRHTDASWFDYSAEALTRRVDQIYWDRLVSPYQPLEEIPPRDAVIFHQKTFALASLVDGTWACRIGNLGRLHRDSDTMLFSIYADEMGRGDIAKNHITLIHNVLASMSIHLPHIRQPAFLDEDELPDHPYGFAIHQLCLSLFPDAYYNEILGYNLGVEMFGLGQLRLHEIQKLRRHRLDESYEQAHLSIDNFSAGHARQSADIIIGYLDGVRRDSGEAAVQQEWRRIWRGYASFAYFVERELLSAVRAQATTPPPLPQADSADLVI